MTSRTFQLSDGISKEDIAWRVDDFLDLTDETSAVNYQIGSDEWQALLAMAVTPAQFMKICKSCRLVICADEPTDHDIATLKPDIFLSEILNNPLLSNVRHFRARSKHTLLTLLGLRKPTHMDVIMACHRECKNTLYILRGSHKNYLKALGHME